MSFTGLLVHWTQLRKGSLSLRISPKKPPKLKGKEKKHGGGKTQKRTPEAYLWGNNKVQHV